VYIKIVGDLAQTFRVSGVSVQPSRRPKTGWSNRKRNFEKANIECRRNVLCLFEKRLSAAIQSFEIRYSIFCGSLFKTNLNIEAEDLSQIHTLTHEVSYKGSGIFQPGTLNPERHNL